MRISSKGDYGLRALLDLAIHYGRGPVRSRDIAERQAIDENYLNQLLIQLRRAGLVQSQRGPQGGHLLAKAPGEVTLLEALQALEGPVVEMAEGIQPSPQADEATILGAVWGGLRDAVEEYLGSLTLEDLAQRKREREGQTMYYI
ncbi:MAG: Rrf2 family transcriptional regulator [Chloroflexota bacterium]|nr:Rrf2 family transcriptional regulator [Chloroflexota bacterium]PLS78647.1 MAG: Rrf2 family transcriptional regulator [Chloroflexota bacterium]